MLLGLNCLIFFGGRSPFGGVAAEKVPRMPAVVNDAGNNWEMADDPVKDGGDREGEGSAEWQHERTRRGDGSRISVKKKRMQDDDRLTMWEGEPTYRLDETCK